MIRKKISATTVIYDKFPIIHTRPSGHILYSVRLLTQDSVTKNNYSHIVHILLTQTAWYGNNPDLFSEPRTDNIISKFNVFYVY